jgi:hypothetical protein
MKQIRHGTGWRLGWNPQAETYRGLVGSDDWAVELTTAELKDFGRLLQQLAATMTQMAEELMTQERIACEAESDSIWLEVEGFPHAYSLRLILYRERGFEGNWHEEAVQELVEAVKNFPNYLE